MIKPIEMMEHDSWDEGCNCSIDEVLITRGEVARVNQLLDLFDRYVKLIVKQEGTNYLFYSDFNDAECVIVNSIHKGHLDD